MRSNKLIVAIDTDAIDVAYDLAHAVSPHCGMLKIGLEIFARYGPAVVNILGQYAPIMLDLKLHDIPTTVGRTVSALAPMRPHWITVHAAGGMDMVQAALYAAMGVPDLDTRPLIAAVLGLTSEQNLTEGMVRAAMSEARHADAFVCPARFAKLVRGYRPDMPLICPGIRLPGQHMDDHYQRTPITPASRHYVDYFVVGRPITAAADPAEAASRFAAIIEGTGE